MPPSKLGLVLTLGLMAIGVALLGAYFHTQSPGVPTVNALDDLQEGRVFTASQEDAAAWLALNPPEVLRPAPTIYTLLTSSYSRPPRAYHTLAHAKAVLECTRRFNEDHPWRDPTAIFIAALFHDAIYEVKETDNEAKSATLASLAIEAYAPDALPSLETASRLIELTASHGTLAPEDVSQEEARFLDCDMSILAAAPAVFDAYEAGIKAEYSPAYPGPLYALGRKRFLKKLLKVERIFLSDYGHERMDAAARENIRRALK